MNEVVAVEVKEVDGGRTIGAVLMTAATFIGLLLWGLAQEYGTT